MNNLVLNLGIYINYLKIWYKYKYKYKYNIK